MQNSPAPNCEYNVGYSFPTPNPAIQNPKSGSQQIRVRWDGKIQRKEHLSLGKLVQLADVLALWMLNVILRVFSAAR